jgi:hypothetical protein
MLAKRLCQGSLAAACLAAAFSPWLLSVATRSAWGHLGDHLLLALGGWCLGASLRPTLTVRSAWGARR